MDTNKPKSSTTAFKQFDAQIDELYSYRDKYYLENEDQDESERNKRIQTKLAKLTGEIESWDEADLGGRACRLVLMGKALNVMPEYDERAFEALTRAIKLEPSSYDAWNYLAECYWKNKDFDMCRNCFERSLGIERNKRALRGMSIVMRQLMKIPTSSG